MREMSDKEIKDCIYDCMIYLDEVCRKNNIKYFISYGTLLGAVRHKDFIPWDNDADVIMDRENYEKFFEVMQKENSNYKLLSYFSDDDYFYPFYKLVDKRTKCEELTFKDIRNMGIYVDIFPIDYLPDDEHERIKVINRIKRKRTWLSLRNIKSTTFIKNFVKRALTLFLNTKKTVRDIDIECKNCTKGCNYMSVLCWGIKVFKKDIFDEIIELTFRDHKFLAPKKYDEYLTICYGDYMTIPPVEKRIVHNYKAYWRD